MSTVTWRDNRLVQRISSIGAEEELGIVTEEPNGKAVLWLRAAEFKSMADAKQNAAGCGPASDAHIKWVVEQGRAKQST